MFLWILFILLVYLSLFGGESKEKLFIVIIMRVWRKQQIVLHARTVHHDQISITLLQYRGAK